MNHENSQITIESLKALFLLDPELIFLNHGSFGACPAEVFDRYQTWQRDMERNPVAFLGRRSAALLADARSTLAQYLGTRPEHLVYVTNATNGVNTVAHSLPLKPGDEVLTTDHEYGACNNAWEHICRRRGARYRPVPIPLPFQASDFSNRIWSEVTPHTRVIFLSHITSTTALLFPIETLCRRAREAGILTVIDGAHAPGHVPLDLEAIGADFYIGNCHKWLCAPKGAAFLHARPEHHQLLDAPIVSWGYSETVTGHTGFDAYTGTSVLERRLQWQGTRDIAPFLTVPTAIAFQDRHQWSRVRQRCHAFAAETLHRVCDILEQTPLCADTDFGQMVAIPVPSADAVFLKDALFDRFHVEIPVTSHGDQLFVRLSVQGYNTQEDLEILISGLQELFSR